MVDRWDFSPHASSRFKELAVISEDPADTSTSVLTNG
jgi:hypothetical protein